MRRIIAGLFTSLDGIVSSSDGWHLPTWTRKSCRPFLMTERE
jgi:hypothetical protein